MADGLDQLREQIIREMRRKNLSGRKVSLGSGLGPNTVNNFLANPQRGMSPTACTKIARFFDWSEDEVLALAGHRSRRGETSAPDDVLHLLRQALRQGGYSETLQRSIFDLAAEGIQLTQAREPAETDAELVRRAEEAWEYAVEPMAAFEGDQVTDEQRLSRVKQRFFRRMWGDLRPDQPDNAEP